MLKEHGFTAADIRDSPQSALDLQRLILQAQAGAEAAALREHQWFISDRSGLDPLIYAHTYVGQEAVARMMEGKDWEVCLRTLRDSLVVVCEPSASWLHDDGTRLMPIDDEEWYQLHTTFCRFLERLGLTYTVVSKEMVNIKERVGLVLDKFLQ